MQKKQVENRKNRKTLKAELKWGDIETIAQITGTSRSSVERWFNDKNDNTSIEVAVNKLIQVRKEKLEEQIKKLA
ncbi:hypothetical protein INR75_02980 [Zunongwangia sp. SCSIO 43204]|uniref:hypothetical protein n=1 Tax=Zunongwangia sp. SCSIO 43204 TaxID=2779359 RepID=UPI001CA86001|nr:hypothetical protein [Zunongwangia sp. SCSIO 43204]UAB85011.1 hypothetical protein INR75_02980 [Zunongwangia sp. SCSIO 43204]